MVKLDIGSGISKRKGYITIDVVPEVNPDLLLDVESNPLPFDSNSVDEIRAWSVLEHFHDDKKLFVICEFWRVLKSGGILDIAVPLCTTEQAWQDPTHLSHWSRRTFWYFTKGNNFRDAFAKRISYDAPEFNVLHEEIKNKYLLIIKLQK